MKNFVQKAYNLIMEDIKYQHISEEQAYNRFNDYFDETEGPVKIAGISYSPSEILKKIDPIAYKSFALTFFEESGLIEDIDYGDGYLDTNKKIEDDDIDYDEEEDIEECNNMETITGDADVIKESDPITDIASEDPIEDEEIDEDAATIEAECKRIWKSRLEKNKYKKIF